MSLVNPTLVFSGSEKSENNYKPEKKYEYEPEKRTFMYKNRDNDMTVGLPAFLEAFFYFLL